MDLLLVKKGLEFTRKRKKWLFLLAACSCSGYGLYKVYNLPAVAQKKKRVLKFLGALISIAEALSDSAETFGLLSKDLNDFLKSDSDKIPNSFKQISKLMNSNELSGSVVNCTQALTRGILGGYRSQARSDEGASNKSNFEDTVFDKLFTTSGSGFASVVVGSFARNLVMAFYSDGQSIGEMHSSSANSFGKDHLVLENNTIPTWLNVVCGHEKCRQLIGDCIQLFVSTAVSVYLDKTQDINTYEQFFTALTNHKHKARVRDVVVEVCNGAIETLVKTSHQVLTTRSSNSSSDSPYLAVDQVPGGARRKKLNGHEAFSTLMKARDCRGWVSQVSSTMAVPSNRKFILDVSGRFTYEMVRSFLEILLEKLFLLMKTSVDVVNEAVVENGIELVRYVTARSSAVATISLSLCLHVLDAPWILAPS